MDKHPGAAGAFLRILLSIALIVSFVPIAPDRALAASEESDKAQVAQLGQDAQGSQTLAGTRAAENDAADSLASPNRDSAVCEYGVLMATGYVYESDSAGAPLATPSEEDPYEGSIDGRQVKHLIVAGDVAKVPNEMCSGSAYLETVCFKSDTLESIGDQAFYQCANLSSISFPCTTDLSIKSIGTEAFFGCKGLSSFCFDKPMTLGSMGESCFAGSGLTSTGLDRIRGLASLPDFAYDGCESLTETCLDENQEIESVGARAFAHCGNLRTTGLEGNVSITSLGASCFAGCDLSGGLVLPRDSKIEVLPDKAFQDTSLDQVLFLCDHAVKIDSDTFPQHPMQVMVPDSLIAHYRTPDVEMNWDTCNRFTQPVAISQCLTAIDVVQDPATMDYAPGQRVSLEGMRISFTLGENRKTFDAARLGEDFVLGRFISIAPVSDGGIFDERCVGSYLDVRYSDGTYFLEAYSSAPLRKAGSQDPLVSIKKVGASASDLVEGSGSYKAGETCLVHASSANEDKPFAYWQDSKGALLSEQPTYEFTVVQDTLLYAVYADKVTVAPQARLKSNDGEPLADVTLSVIADGVDRGNAYDTYEGKNVRVSCAYDPAEYALDSWVDLRDGRYLGTGDTIDYEARAGRTPVAVFTRAEEPACEVTYSQSIDLGGRELAEGVSLPDVEGSITVNPGEETTLDAAALGMTDGNIAFTGWFNADTGELLSGQDVCTFAPTGDMRVQARFALKSTEVRVMPAQSTDFSQDYAHLTATTGNCYRDAGETVPLSATADNARFLGWYTGTADDSHLYSDALACDYTITDSDAAAGFATITPWYCAERASVVLSVGEATEDGAPAGQFLTTGLYGKGSRVTVNAIPAAGYVFDRIVDARGNVVSTSDDGTSYTFTLAEDTQLTAHFRATENDDEALLALKVALTAAIGTLMAIGTFYGAGAVVDPIGTEAIIEIEAATNIEEVAAVGKKAIEELEEAIEKAKHDRDPDKPRPDSDTVEIAATAIPEAGGIVRGGGVHHEGTMAELEAIPNPGYRFVCWKEDGVERSRSPLLTMAVTDATPRVVAMTAVFERDATITTAIELEGAADAAIGCNATPDRQTVERGREATVVATEGAEWAFVGWFENGVEVSRAKTYVFSAESDRHLIAKFRKAGRSIAVAAEPAGSADILCNGVPVEGGVVKAEDGDVLTFTAHPNARPDDPEKAYTLVEWRESGEHGPDVVNRQDTCTYQVNGNARLVAVMDGKDSHTARAVADPEQGGEVVLACGDAAGTALEVPAGQEATATARAADGYVFDGWYVTYGTADVAGSIASMDPTYTFAPLSDCTVRARFQRMCEVNVAVEPAAALAGKYTVLGAGTCAQGQPVVLSIELNPSVRDEFSFEGWYRDDCGLLLGTDPSHLEFTPEDGETTIRAVFRAKEYTITATARKIFKERGTVEIEGHAGADSVTVGWGDTVTLKARANDGYKLKCWKSDSGKEYTGDELTVRVTKDETYTAVFVKWYPEVVIAADSWFGGTVFCNGQEVTSETSTTDAFKLGDTLHLQAEPRVGWIFWGWYVNGLFKSASRECTVQAAGAFGKAKQCTVTAAFKPASVLCVPVASPSEGGSVQASRIVSDRGEDIALKATAAPGYAFVGWYKDGVELESTEPEFTHREAASCLHVAKFEKRAYRVEAAATEETDAGELVESDAAGWVEGAGSVDAGCAAELSAHERPGYAFDRWIDGEGNTVSRDETYRFVPAADATLRAIFAAKRFTIDVSAVEGFGSATGGGVYAAGDTVVVSAEPNEDSLFIGWYSAGACVSTDATYRFAATCDMALEAVFDLGPCSVQAVASPVEAGYVSGFGGFNEGERTTLRAVARTGFTFECWKDSQGNVAGERPEITVTAHGAERYTACFTRNSYEVDLDSSTPGVGVLSGAGTYEFGQVVEIDAKQTDDKRFVGWYLIDSEENATLFSEDARCWFALDENLVRDLDDDVIALRAEFADPYDVAVGANVVVKDKTGTRGCKVSGGGVFSVGDDVTLSATSGLGYRFAGWSTDEEGDGIVETNAVLNLTADKDTTYYALFEVDEQIEITVSQSSILRGKALLVGDFGIAGSKAFDKGDTFVAMAVAWPGYHFSHWIDDAGAIASYSAIYVGIARETRQLSAVFYQSAVDVQVTTYPSGSAFSMVVPGTGAKYKSAAVLISIPYPGWEFKYWADENAMPIGFSNVIVRPTLQNRTFTAYYVKKDPDNPDPDNPEPGPNPDPDNPDPDNPDPGPNPGPDPDNPEPSDPNDPEGPDNPDDPSGPSDPSGPDNPAGPDNPDNPADPANPSEPNEPPCPDEPGNPTAPGGDAPSDASGDIGGSGAATDGDASSAPATQARSSSEEAAASAAADSGSAQSDKDTKETADGAQARTEKGAPYGDDSKAVAVGETLPLAATAAVLACAAIAIIVIARRKRESDESK